MKKKIFAKVSNNQLLIVHMYLEKLDAAHINVQTTQLLETLQIKFQNFVSLRYNIK